MSVNKEKRRPDVSECLDVFLLSLLQPGGIINPSIKEPILACLKAFITYDFYFDKLAILSTYAYIKNSNIKSHNYAKSLGYKQDESKNNGEFYYYTLNKDDYIAKRYRYLSIT